jgi:hypothetical protein
MVIIFFIVFLFLIYDMLSFQFKRLVLMDFSFQFKRLVLMDFKLS